MREKPTTLAILGAYPPPAGGVSVHVQRLCPLLEQRGTRFLVYNAVSDATADPYVVSVYRKRRLWMCWYALSAKETDIYILSSRLIAWLVGAFLAIRRRKRVLIRLRNSDLPDWTARSTWRRLLAGFALRHVSGVVCVSRYLEDAARSIGVSPNRIHYAPGFLPPDLSPSERARVDPRVWAYIDSHEPLIVANGKVEWHQGVDLYALDLLVELAGRLKTDYRRLGIVVCFWDHLSEDADYLASLCSEAERLGVADNILFNTSPGPLVPVLAEADLFVRPTNTDGDANSIREALYLRIPTVASDAVERPEGVLLFRSRDIVDFEAKVRSVLTSDCRDGARSKPVLDEQDQMRIQKYLDLLTNAGRESTTIQ